MGTLSELKYDSIECKLNVPQPTTLYAKHILDNFPTSLAKTNTQPFTSNTLTTKYEQNKPIYQSNLRPTQAESQWKYAVFSIK